MEILLLILTSTIISALFFGFFALGYYIRDKKPNNESLDLTERNKKVVEEMAKWRSWEGK